MSYLKRKININYIKAILGIGIIVFLIAYLEPSSIYETYLKADKYYLILAILLLPLNLYLQFIKWKIISIKYFGISDNSKIWLSLLYGISGGLFTPMKSGEYVARAIPYKKAKVVDVVLGTMVDKIIPLYFVLLLGGVFSAVYFYQVIHFSVSAILSLFFAYLLILIFIPYLILGNSALTHRVKYYLSRNKYFLKIIPKISFLKEIDKKTLLKLVLLAIVFNLVFTLQMTILLISFSGEFNLWLFFIISNLIIFLQIIIPPIALGEIGIREGASIFFMHSYGFSGAIGFNAAFSLFIINLLIPSMIGFFLLLKRDKD